MKKILVVEDSLEIRTLTVNTIDDGQNQILEAEDGLKAMEVIEKEHPDIVLLDITIPEIDGFEVCRRIKSNPATKGIYVIMISARGQESDKEIAKEIGADDYFIKPYSPIQLLEKIDKVIEDLS